MTSRTILVVEDYDDTRELMRLMLAQEGYRVLEAEDGFTAVETVGRELPDLVLMDLSLPLLDGISATKRIKANTATQNIPIISVTAHDEEHRRQAIAAGCCEAIRKPVIYEDLKAVMLKYLPA